MPYKRKIKLKDTVKIRVENGIIILFDIKNGPLGFSSLPSLEILNASDGKLSENEIIEKFRKKYPYVNKDCVSNFIVELVKAGFLEVVRYESES